MCRNAISFLFTLFTLINAASAECTRDQAFNKMMELNKYSTQLQMQMPDPKKDPSKFNQEQEKFQTYSKRLASGGPLLAAQKYNEACKVYEDLAKDFKVPESNGKTLTMERLHTDGGRGPQGSCDLTAAAMKMAELSNAFKKAADAGKFPYERSREFGVATEKIGIAMNEDPSRACLMIDQAYADFKLR
jgi:hypothetical protein